MATRQCSRKVSIEVARGEFVAIVGESGVGKSTLLNCMAGLDSWDEGSIILDGHDLAALNDDQRALLRRRQIGFVFQAFHVLPHLDVAQNVALPLMLLGQPDDARVESMLRAVGLDGLGPRLPQQLSGGQLQRVAIARALVHRPATVLADEPTGNLDPRDGRQGDGRADLANPRARRFIGAGHAFRGGRDARRPGAASDQRGRDRQAIAAGLPKALRSTAKPAATSSRGICPGAELFSPTAKVMADPKAQPHSRVTDPNPPMDMLTTGMSSFSLACSVASSKVSTSCILRWHDGHLGHIRTQPLRFVEPLPESFRDGVRSKSWNDRMSLTLLSRDSSRTSRTCAGSLPIS